MLVGGAKKQPLLVAKYLFRAIALVNIEIEDRDLLQTMCVERMGGSNRNVVVQAKTHRTVALGMVPRRPHGAECRLHLATGYKVNALDDGAGSTARSVKTTAADHRIGIETCIAALRYRCGDGIKMSARMHTQ